MFEKNFASFHNEFHTSVRHKLKNEVTLLFPSNSFIDSTSLTSVAKINILGGFYGFRIVINEYLIPLYLSHKLTNTEVELKIEYSYSNRSYHFQIIFYSSIKTQSVNNLMDFFKNKPITKHTTVGCNIFDYSISYKVNVSYTNYGYYFTLTHNRKKELHKLFDQYFITNENYIVNFEQIIKDKYDYILSGHVVYSDLQNVFLKYKIDSISE